MRDFLDHDCSEYEINIDDRSYVVSAWPHKCIEMVVCRVTPDGSTIPHTFVHLGTFKVKKQHKLFKEF